VSIEKAQPLFGDMFVAEIVELHTKRFESHIDRDDDSTIRVHVYYVCIHIYIYVYIYILVYNLLSIYGIL